MKTRQNGVTDEPRCLPLDTVHPRGTTVQTLETFYHLYLSVAQVTSSASDTAADSDSSLRVSGTSY